MTNPSTTANHSVSYDDLMVGDSILVPAWGTFHSVAWAGNGIVAIEVGGDALFQIIGCEAIYFDVAP